MFQLSLLGSFRAIIGEKPIQKFGSKKTKALLIYLAVERHQIHQRESLMTMLWPGLPLKSAQQNLRQILYLLKRDIQTSEMEVPFILAERFTLAWNPAAPLTLDIAEFEKLTHNQNVADWQQAIDLYRGEFLRDFFLADSESFEEWVANKRAFYHHTALDVLDRSAAHYLRQHQWELAETIVRRSLELDKLQEISHRRLIEILARKGHRQEALIHYNSLCQLLYEEMGLESEPETKSLVAAIRAGELGEKVSFQINLGEPARLVSETIRSQPHNNLPHASTSFIGRESELAEIWAKLNETDCRLLTLLGPGGYGKTRLAVEAAAGVLDNFKHGAFFVNLAPLQATDQISSTIAGAISFSFYGNGPPEEQLLDYLHNKEMLLIFDNFEHLLDGAFLVLDILNAAPRLKILTTSRVRLALTDEHLYYVMGMSHPESPVSLEVAAKRYSAVSLFESQARQLQVDFELTDENIGDVIRICSALEGMPLGIVLAASWVALLSPAEIAEEIARDLAFLDTELRNLPQRQRSLQSVFNHSWRLLSEREQQIMAALSVFRGGFTRETAHAIAGASLFDLRGLLDKSMVQRSTNDRYEVHELLRQYAAENLAVDPSVEARIREAHSSFFCQALTGWERDLQGPLQIMAIQEMTVELDNIRVAWAWALEKTRIKPLLNALNGLCIFFNLLHRQRLEGQTACRSLVEKLAVSTAKQHGASSQADTSKNQIYRLKLQARALAWGGYFNAWLGNADLSLQLIQNCRSLIEGSELSNEDTRFEKALAYRMFPWVMNDAKQSKKIKIAEEAVQLFESLGEFWWVSSALLSLGFALQSRSRSESIKVFERSLAVCRNQQDLSGIALSLEILSNAKAQFCQFEAAESLAYEALSIYQELQNRYRMVVILMRLGSHLVWQGRYEEARTIYQETLETHRDLADTQSFASIVHAHAGFPDQYLGAYKAARSQAEHALQLLGGVEHLLASYGSALAVSILGRIALVEGFYLEADRYFHKCLPLFRDHHVDDIGQMHACLGYTTRKLNQASQSRSQCYRALNIAVKNDSFLSLIHTLPGIALLFADLGHIERALELYTLATTMEIVGNSKWFEDIAGNEIAMQAEKLPPDLVEAAIVRGRSMDMWETAADLLEELDELGWGSIAYQNYSAM